MSTHHKYYVYLHPGNPKLTQKPRKRVNIGTTRTGKGVTSMKEPHFVDSPTENKTTSMKTGVLVDRRRKIEDPSMKTGNFMDNIQ